MSMATLERAILAGARTAFNNPKLRQKDIREWACGKIKKVDGETLIYVSEPGVYVAIKTENDKRNK